MRKVLWVAALLFSVALAGCTDSDDTLDPAIPPGAQNGGNGDAQDLTDEETNQLLSGQMPATWALGHTWTYSTSLGTEITLVVHDETEDSWLVGTPDEDVAWFHAREEVSYIGEIWKDHLSGSQDDDPVQYFDFPLEEGKEWTTTWDGEERRIIIVDANETFRFEAYEGDHLAVEYDYDPEVGWFTEMTFHPQEEEGFAFSMELSDHGTDWSGRLKHWDADRHLFTRDNLAMANGNFQVEEGTEELWVRAMIPCDQTAMVHYFSMAPESAGPDHEAMLLIGDCTEEEIIEILEEPEPGRWHYSFGGLGPDPEEPGNPFNRYQLEAWGRTLETIEV